MSALTAEDRALLREAIRYAHAQGWCRESTHLRRQAHWFRDADGNSDGVHVAWDRRPDDTELWTGRNRRIVLETQVTSATRAVDLLVALGVLPVHLSSAYRAGRIDAARAVERMPITLGDEGWDHLARKAVEANCDEALVRRRQRDDRSFTNATIEAAYQYGYRRAAEVARA